MTPSTLRIQEQLSKLGFDPGPMDGAMGPRTESAIIAFKKANGLRARSFVGPLTLQALFDDLSEESDMPWMDAAGQVKGLHEARNRSQLRGWFDRSVAWIDPREIAWCGAFVATCYRKWQPNTKLPDNPLGARNWNQFGKRCAPVFGSCLTFWRVSRQSWQGHVGFYWGEDKTHFHVLGGNQSNAVTVTRIAKSRLLEARWPVSSTVAGPRVLLSANGVPVSHNEA
ncbi:MAG: peptidoglycan-binding protein [Aliishimia sp.]